MNSTSRRRFLTLAVAGTVEPGKRAQAATAGRELFTFRAVAGLPAEVSAFDTNRQCGSSMETLHRVAQSIQVGATHFGIAIGIERMGRQLGGGGAHDRHHNAGRDVVVDSADRLYPLHASSHISSRLRSKATGVRALSARHWALMMRRATCWGSSSA